MKVKVGKKLDFEDEDLSDTKGVLEQKKEQDELDIRERIETNQTTALIKPARVLKRVPEI